jgi:adenylate kinase
MTLVRRNVLLFGPQGSGKGTQGEKLSAHLGLPFIVTGNIFRQNIKDGTAIGERIKSYINQGKLVPDAVTNAMIAERVRQRDCQVGFVLDGFPRNLAQAEALAAVVAVTHLLHITIPDAEAIRRIAERRTCVAGGHVYHLSYNPPKTAGVCDVDGSALHQRDDDTEAALSKRLEIYHTETEPLLEYYSRLGVVKTIHGEQSIADVWQDIQAIFT